LFKPSVNLFKQSKNAILDPAHNILIDTPVINPDSQDEPQSVHWQENPAINLAAVVKWPITMDAIKVVAVDAPAHDVV
jgi:hypothetical protein